MVPTGLRSCLQIRLSAESSLADIFLCRLRERVNEYADLEKKYSDLKDEIEIMKNREVMAIDEIESLGVQNAELMGRGSDQKISYVDGL